MSRALLAAVAAALLGASTAGAQVPGVPSSCRVPHSALHLGSRSMGLPSSGWLVGGVPFPEETDYSFTWDDPNGLSPSPQWRRYGTEKLVLTLQCVLSAYGAAHPDLARVGVADLSRRGGGPFGPRYGGLGHASHQNGLDADVLYPRRDLCECPPDSPADVDVARAQELIDRFVRAGAEYLFVSPTLYRRGLLRGPPGVVIPLQYHEDHVHVRIYPDRAPRRTPANRRGPD
jgi:murein endopeptidase